MISSSFSNTQPEQGTATPVSDLRPKESQLSFDVGKPAGLSSEADNKRKPQKPLSQPEGKAKVNGERGGGHKYARRRRSKVAKNGFQSLAVLISYLYRVVLTVLTIKLQYWKKHPIHGLVTSWLCILLVLVVDAGAKVYQQLMFEPVPEKTLSDIIELSKFTRGFNMEKVAKKGNREFLRAGAPAWMQRESVRAILYHARQQGLSFEHQAVLLTIAEIESGFNPMARASTSTACGLFQFVKATGKRYGLTPATCMDPVLNSAAGVEHYMDNFNKRVRKKVDALTGPEKLIEKFKLSYFLHHDGPTSDNHSDKLKAIILEATPYLLKSYAILEQEGERLAQQSTFFDKFMQRNSDRFSRALDDGKNLLKGDVSEGEQRSNEIISTPAPAGYQH